MAYLNALLTLRGTALGAARTALELATKGLPAARAALHGVRLGAGAGFSPAVLEQVGLSVLPGSARAAAEALGRATQGAALVVRRGATVVRAAADELVVHGREGLTLRVSSRGSARAAVTRDAVDAVARSSTRVALAGVGRAALQGAAAGAALDGAIAGLWAVRAFRRGELSGRLALRHVGLHAARGAIAGASGVAAAGIVSAAVVATGVGILGAPIALPFAAMVTTSTVVGRYFDALVLAPR